MPVIREFEEGQQVKSKRVIGSAKELAFRAARRLRKLTDDPVRVVHIAPGAYDVRTDLKCGDNTLDPNNTDVTVFTVRCR